MKKFSGISVAVAVLAAATLAGCPPQPTGPAFNSQNFAAGSAAATLAGKLFTFAPDGSESYYSRTVMDGLTGFVNNEAGTVIDFGTNDPFELALGTPVMYFGTAYSTIYIGSDGTVAFGTAGTGNGSVANHFSANQVSLLPVDATDDAGAVSYVVNANSVVVTFDGVDDSSFQAVFYTAGAMNTEIDLAYPTVSANAGGVVGLSRGQLIGASQAEIDAFLADFGDGDDLGMDNTSTAKLGF